MSKSQQVGTIRHALKEDVPSILQMIQELADYEKESSSVLATVESLTSTIAFGPPTPPTTDTTTTALDPSTLISRSRPARCLLVFSPTGIAAGMALYFCNYSTWRSKPGIFLEDLYVKESERGHGYGKLLLKELAKEVVKMEGGRLEWSVLKWNVKSIGFYESEGVGAKRLEEWVGMRVDGEALGRLAGSDI